MGKMLDMGSVDDSPQGQGVDEAPDVFSGGDHDLLRKLKLKATKGQCEEVAKTRGGSEPRKLLEPSRRGSDEHIEGWDEGGSAETTVLEQGMSASSEA